MTTDFASWIGGLEGTGIARAGPGAIGIVALTAAGPVEVLVRSGFDALWEFPPDRMALGPATYGGMVVLHGAAGEIRVVCADPEGGLAVVQGDAGALGGGGPRSRADLACGGVAATGLDHDALGLLWRLMDAEVTRPTVEELAARVLVWAWLAHPRRRLGPGYDDEGVACAVAGDLGALGALVGVDPPPVRDAEGVRLLAEAVGHPALDWDRFPWVVGEVQRIDVLHACLPTRWAIADELRSYDGRPDLADAVMEAPAPRWWTSSTRTPRGEAHR